MEQKMRVTAENVRRLWEFGQFKKTKLTEASPEIKLGKELTVDTKEGEYNLPAGWEGRIAIDSEGDPYPIAKSEFDSIYEEA
jgi:hypothetical protein